MAEEAGGVLRALFMSLGLTVDEASFAKGVAAGGALEKALEKTVESAKEFLHSIIENISGVAEYADKLRELSQATGTTTDDLQRMAKFAAQEGVGIDELGHSLQVLTRFMGAAKGGSEETQAAFRKLGVRVTDGNGKLRNASEVFADLTEAFKKMDDGAEKVVLAQKVLGKQGAEMIKVFNQGRDELEKFSKVKVMTPDQVDAGDEIIKTQRAINAQTKALWREAIGPLLPVIRDLLKRYLEWKKANAEIMKQKIREWIGFVVKGINLAADAFSFIVKNMAAVKVILGVLAFAFAALEIRAVAAAVRAGLAWAVALAPFLLLGGLIAGLLLIYDDLAVYQRGVESGNPEKHKSLYGRFKKEIDSWLKPNDKDPWFLAAIKSFLGFIKETIEALQQLDAALHRYDPQKIDKQAATGKGEQQRVIDNITIKTAKARVAQGLPLTPAETAALKRSGVPVLGFVRKYAPSDQFSAAPTETPGTGPASAGPTQSISIGAINVETREGQDNREIAREVAKEVVEEAMSRENEDLMASE